MFILLTLGNTYAGVCDEFGLDASDSYYIPAPITKFCVLAGSDPPKKWVPEKGFGKGLTTLHSGLQVVTGKASSLCPSPKMGDGAKGCPNFQFPNCATIPSDDPAQQTAQAKSGACVKGDAAIEETANASENDVDETYEDITADDIKCAVQLDMSTTYTSADAPQSVCYGGNAKFCSLKGEKGTCDTQFDSELPNTDYPHDYALDGYVQMNDIDNIKIGSAWLPDLSGGPAAFTSMTPEDQDMMIDSMFHMTGDFKTPNEILIELNNNLYRKWDKKNKNWLGITTSVDLFEEKCTRSTIIVPANTLFSIRNLPGKDVIEKYIVFWNNSPTLYKRTMESGTNEGSRTQDTALPSLFVGKLPPGEPQRELKPSSPKIILNGKPLMKSGNTAVYKAEIAPHDYELANKTENWLRCRAYTLYATKGVYFYLGDWKEFKVEDIINYGSETATSGWGASKTVKYVKYKCNETYTAYDEWGGEYTATRTECKVAQNTCSNITKEVRNYTIENLNFSQKFRLCAKRKCRWSWPSNPLAVITGCDGKSGWEYINN